MKIRIPLIQLVRRLCRRPTPSTILPCPAGAQRRLAPSSRLAALAICLATALATRAQTPVPPVVSGVTAAQEPGNKLVDISYTISDANFTNDNVFVLASQDSGATWTVPALTFSGTYGTNISVTTTPTVQNVIWNAGADWDGNYTTNCRVRVLANNLGLVLIPPGTYQRGNAMSADTDITDAPQYPVYVGAFYMDSTLVTGGKWNLVVQSYASSHGYTFDDAGSFKADNHPVQSVNWYDAVKWCNARSQMEGVTPCYYTNAALTALYTNGDVVAVYVNWSANGYRLPTEAEWEKAARGGATGHRFPWSSADTISESEANYAPGSGGYDLSGNGSQTYATGAQPYTSPVGSFGANGYGLFDMAGNVEEWCWDWYGNYTTTGTVSNPQGPGSGIVRVIRGGDWNSEAFAARCANRNSFDPSRSYSAIGFRCVRGVP